MPIAHLRNLAKYGVITDIDPYDLAPEAFSAGVNVRFRNGKITGAPVFRNVLHLGASDPRYVFSSNPTSGLDLLFIGYLNGSVSRVSGQVETAYSVSGYVPSPVEATWSSTTLANVTYVNRSDRAPWYLRTSDPQFQDLASILLTATAATATSSPTLTFASVPTTIVAGMSVTDKTTGLSVGTVSATTATTVTLAANAAHAVAIGDVVVFQGGAAQWAPSWSCAILRTCGGALVALNVTKSGVASPTMVKTSSIPLAGTVPVSWDQTQPDTLATENILADMAGGIVDACRLGSDLIIYGQKEAWRMTPNGQLSEFSYVPLPLQKGAINANCCVELDGTNIVFGPDDIWQHDGNSEKSLCDGKVRDYIYGSINMSRSNRCFVVHNPKLTEISFCYVSGDGLIAFSGADGCNRAAVYNYGNQTWTFDDLPLVFSGAPANLSNPATYATATASYDTLGGSYQDQEDGFKRNPCFVGASNTTYGLSTSLYGADLFGQGSTLAFPVDVNATKPKYLERDGIDLDEVGADLRGQKTLVSIYPQVRLGKNAAQLMINGGSAEAFGDGAEFVGYQPYDGDTITKCDFNSSGRYLSLRVQHNDFREMTVAGFDLEFAVRGKRG